jgi:serine phosphatase RsbU (regulator of sigma subunit)
MRGMSVYSDNLKTSQQWISEIRAFQRTLFPALGESIYRAQDQIFPVIFIDHESKSWQDWVISFDRTEITLILVVEDHNVVPNTNDLKLVDEVLVHPFRMMDLLSLVRRHHSKLNQKQTNQKFLEQVAAAQEVVDEANKIVEKVLFQKTPKRFTGIKGVSIASRHLSGLKPGGDYFDVFESKNNEFVNFMLADSSSYGLSSALLGMILSSSARLASDVQMNPSQWIQAIVSELKVQLGTQDHLNVFFGRLNKKTFSLSYQLYGSIEAFVMNSAGQSLRLEKNGGRIGSDFIATDREQQIVLNPKDRVVLLSDGFVHGVGGEHALNQVFNQQSNQDPFHLVNELSYQIKSKLGADDIFPGEDCSAIVIDVESRLLRLAPVG